MKVSNKAERTRDHIISVSAPIFNTKGFAGTSLSDIIHGTGLSKGAIYGHFENKQEIALEVFGYNLNIIQSKIQLEIDSALNNREKLLSYVKIYKQVNTIIFPAGGCPILNTAVESEQTNPQLRSRAGDAILKWKEKLISILQDGIGKGEFRGDINLTDVALSIIALIEGGMVVSKGTGKQELVDAILRQINRLIQDISVSHTLKQQKDHTAIDH